MKNTIELAESSGEFVYDMFRVCDLIKAMEDVKYWEQDITNGIYVCQVPSGDVSLADQWAYMLVWKQKNNGLTFVVSEIELPHLNHISMISDKKSP